MARVSTHPHRFWLFKGSGGERQPLIEINDQERFAPRARLLGPISRPARWRSGRLLLGHRCRVATVLRARFQAAPSWAASAS